MSKSWKTTLADVLGQHNSAKIDGRTASKKTRKKRADVLFSGFEELRDAGYRLIDVHSFRETHMHVLGRFWEKNGLAPSVIVNRISIFRVFAGWIGKPGMIGPSERYVDSPESVKRSTICKDDKSWSAKGIDIAAKIAEVSAIDRRVAIMLEFEWRFGLRPLESLLIKPHQADQGSWLLVVFGAKNARPRPLPIDRPEQRELLDRAKSMTRLNESLADPYKTAAQADSAFYRVMKKAGITKKNGITAHGLRHQFANDTYEAIAGSKSPVRGGSMPTDEEVFHFARQQVALLLGHGREDIATHYIGSFYAEQHGE